ncbi:hypothetical protein B0H21DRAFT_458447 [Amylocystis lapponica]|nr:hypothetical protein B0H21DRAFT_458447 [Amylocystis lapponica]
MVRLCIAPLHTASFCGGRHGCTLAAHGVRHVCCLDAPASLRHSLLHRPAGCGIDVQTSRRTTWATSALLVVQGMPRCRVCLDGEHMPAGLIRGGRPSGARSRCLRSPLVALDYVRDRRGCPDRSALCAFCFASRVCRAGLQVVAAPRALSNCSGTRLGYTPGPRTTSALFMVILRNSCLSIPTAAG